MLGEEVVDRYRVINHDAFDAAGLTCLGEVEPRVPVWLNRQWVAADVRITTASSSRTSSPASAAAPSWSRPAWRDSRRPCGCTTPR